MTATVWWLVPVAYLVGSIPWGLLVVRALKGVDVRERGSGKTGMTNVLRTAGKGPAVAVLLWDASKGVGLVMVARALTDDSVVHAFVAGAVVVGHVWPVLAGFRGGRGIATGAGVAAGLEPLTVLLMVTVFLPVVGITRYVSLASVGSVVAVAASFVVAGLLGVLPIAYLWFALATGTLIVAMHRDNLLRLLRGTERRLGKLT